MAELLDFFFYLHDIFNLGIPQLNDVLTDHLIQYLLFPQFLGSLLQADKTEPLEDRLSPFVALYLLGQVFYAFTHKPLIEALAGSLVGRPNSYSPTMRLPPRQRNNLHSRNHSAPDITESINRSLEKDRKSSFFDPR